MQVIDTSTIARFALREEGWERLIDYLREGTTMPFAVVELGNVFWKRLIKNRINEEAVIDILEGFSTYYTLLSQNRHLVSALKISKENRLPFYDRLFIAAAAGEGYGLVTCDRKQAEVARKLGVKVIEVG